MKRFHLGSDSSDYSNSQHDSEIRHKNNRPMLSSPLTMKHERDDDVSSTELPLVFGRTKLRKTTDTNVTPSSASLKMAWTKKDDILILSSIVDYYKKSKLRFNRSNDEGWGPFYQYMRGTMGSDFSKKQLRDKVGNLKQRFRANLAKANDGEELSFPNADAEQVFKFSKIIWAEEFASKDNAEPTKEDVPCAEHERVSKANTEIDDNGDKEKSEEDGVDDFCVLLDTLEAATSFQSLSGNQRKFLLRNLKNIGANQRKELTDEWKTLLAEEMQLDIKKMQLDIKKQTFSAKLVNIGFSA